MMPRPQIWKRPKKKKNIGRPSVCRLYKIKCHYHSMCMRACMSLRVHACMSACVYAHVGVCVYVRMRVCPCAGVRAHVCACVSMVLMGCIVHNETTVLK